MLIISHSDGHGLIGAIRCKSFNFSGGETHVRIESDDLYDLKPDDCAFINITAHLRSTEDVMELLMTTDALRRRYSTFCKIDLEMPYLPYARQDRVCFPGEAFALQVFCRLINAQGYNSVHVWDVHSGVALNLLNSSYNVEASTLIMPLKNILKPNTIVVAPDLGAVTRASQCSATLNLDLVKATKLRDPETGEITGTLVDCEHVGDRDFIIVDDICDGGRTFIELAKVLRHLTTGDIYLYVTHGIFSAGFEALGNHIDHIWTANSFVPDHRLPTIVNVLRSK